MRRLFIIFLVIAGFTQVFAESRGLEVVMPNGVSTGDTEVNVWG